VAEKSSAFPFMKKYFLFLIIISIVMILLLPIYALEVKVAKTEVTVYQQPANLGEQFDIIWTHSVTLQPVIETYRIDRPGKISLIQMIFDDNGPNLPARPEYNQKWLIKDGKFIVSNYDLVFERVPVTIGAIIANHTLQYNDKLTNLKEVYRPGGYVLLGITKKNIFNYLTQEVEIWLKNQK